MIEMSSKDKKIFIARLIFFTIFACILPFIYISLRYELFTKVSKIQVGGWGCVAIVLVLFFVSYVAKMIKKGIPYSMLTQCLTGFCKVVVPLLMLYVFVYNIKESANLFLNVLLITIVCETIAVPLNPFPKWLEDHKRSEQDSLADMIIDKFNKSKSREE